jgi:hypothetical protein
LRQKGEEVRLTDLSYEDWLEHAFGHEVRIQQAAWFFDQNCDLWDPEPAVALAYLTRLYEDPEPALRWFSDNQIAQGLTYLLDMSASGDKGWFSSTEVPIESRVRCVEAIASLFARLFVLRCTPHLSHLSETDAGSLNNVCYMWWDGFPCLALPGDPDKPMMHEAALCTMARILGFHSLACQESALHGLGHWQRDHDRHVCAIIDGFLADSLGIDPRLIGYANAARRGCVL